MITDVPRTHGRSLAYLAAVPALRVGGIGPKSASWLADIGIESVTDLLLHPPRRYLDRSELYELARVPIGEEVTVGGIVQQVARKRLRRNRLMTRAVLFDGTRTLTAVWFNPYLKIDEGWEVLLSGKVELFRGTLQMKSPDMERLGTDSLEIGRVVPVHPGTKKFTPAKMRSSVADALRRSRPITEVLPVEVLERLELVERDRAIADLHFPDTTQDAIRARRRLVFDEFFRLQVALALRKRRQIEEAKGIAHDVGGELASAFTAALPYALTDAQRRAIAEIEADLAAPHPMHRLLQGEVGSGKTVVAVAALLGVVENGYQGAVMAPTEVLAEQHYLGMRDLVELAGMAPAEIDPSVPPGQENLFAGDGGAHSRDAESGHAVRIALLTSSTAQLNDHRGGEADRRTVVDRIAEGTVDIVVGTHSLIQEGLHFATLGLAVVDEQHRFGVYQRVALREKGAGYDPDLLIMTATPIPRTLSMTLYGDLDVSVIDEMPPGRSPVRTIHVAPTERGLVRVYDLIRREVAEGRQAFVVCPLVEDSDKLEAASATAEYERLRDVFADLRLGLLHGQLRPAEKENVMTAFRRRDLDLLVATTVIEVGIDVPNATVMVIEDADRFGLSQLHQLRGRVGRGAHPATCVLVAEPSTVEASQRIAAMVETTDGFHLAEEDLRIRGQGTVLGARQAGMSDLRLADVLRDRRELFDARREAFDLVASDPELTGHREIADEVRALLGDDVEWLFRS